MENNNNNNIENTNLKLGFIKLNTSYIPTFFSKERVMDCSVLEKNIYIKSNIPLLIEIGGVKYTIESGEHYIPNLHIYHHIKILTDLSNNEECEVYHNCICDDKYHDAFIMMCQYNFVLVKSIHSENESTIFIFGSGMGGSTTYEKIYDKKVNGDNINFSSDCRWLSSCDIYKNKDPTKDTYSQFIYDINIAQVQKDNDVTQYLINWDKKFVRDSMPPCIAICYSETNYEELKDVLKRKYNIKLSKPREPHNVIKIKPFENILSQIRERNDNIKKYEDMGIFEFVALSEMPFTIDLYNKLKKQCGDSDIPYEDLIEYE